MGNDSPAQCGTDDRLELSICHAPPLTFIDLMPHSAFKRVKSLIESERQPTQQYHEAIKFRTGL